MMDRYSVLPSRIVPQTGRKSAFHSGNRHARSCSVTRQRIFADSADGKVVRFLVSEIEPANRRGGKHGVILRQRDVGRLLHSEQIEKDRFLRMIWAGGITRGGPNTAVLLGNQIIDGQGFLFAISPFSAAPLVQVFGEGFR